MWRRTMLGFALAAAAALALATPALAGGWAVVTLDELPGDVRAGQSLSLGFTVRQHGQTLVDVHAWEGDMPFLSATNLDTRDQLHADARKEGPIGHYVVDVTFPSDGRWEWSITPGPFEATRLGTLEVLPAAPVSTAPDAPAAQPRLSPIAGLQILGGLLLVAAAGAALVSRRPQRRAEAG